MGAQTLNDVYDYALSLYATPYQWGGGHDVALDVNYGLDCSGYVRKLVAYAGCGPAGDHTADDFYHYYLGNGYLNTPGMGAMAFFGTTDRVHHIGFCIDSKIMLSAAGGGSHVNTAIVASRANAMVKIEPIDMRHDFLCVIMPLYQLPLT
jgi:cell wall-associated NlpC family hydrolase